MPAMEKIASFTVDHLTLEPGVYVSRVDRMRRRVARLPRLTCV